MGLDWCLRDKIVEGQEHNHMFAEAHCERLNKEIDAAYTAYLDEHGIDPPPMVFPNKDTDAFRETKKYKELYSDLTSWMETRASVSISPMETMGCPRIGIDDKATEWARNYYSKIKGIENGQEHHARFCEQYPTEDKYIEEMAGRYVAELAEKKEGLGLVTGIAVGPESFRGKIIGKIPWLSPSLSEGAYADRDPEELRLYGVELTKEAKTKEKELSDSEGSELKEEVDIVLAAGAWCTFWGEQGHSMSAWY